jgi:hypothetical protein
MRSSPAFRNSAARPPFARLLALWLALAAGFAAAKPRMVVVTIADVHPTQFAVGRIEIEHRIEGFRKAGIALDAVYEDEDPERISVVLAPDGNAYVVDGHHHLASLDELGVTRARVAVKKDWSKLESMDVFWEKMQERRWVYLRDAHNRPRTIRSLPESLRAMANDPYRSLAWLVRQLKGFRKSKTPFAEFAWAIFFRQYIHISDPDDREEIRRAAQKGWQLARSDAASGLPGYRSNSGSFCASRLRKLAKLVP